MEIPTVDAALWQHIGAIALWLGFVFGIAEGMRRSQADAELVRKVVHIGTGNVIFLAWLLQLPLWLCLSFAIAFSILAFVSRFLPVLPMLDGVGRKTQGVLYYAVSIGLLVGWFWGIGQPQYAAIGIAVMAWGDGLAALVGQRFGKHPYQFLGSHKTLEGSLTMFGVSAVVTLLVLVLAEGGGWRSPAIAVPVALVATILEAISPGGTDNLSVPLGSASLCYALSLLL